MYFLVCITQSMILVECSCLVKRRGDCGCDVANVGDTFPAHEIRQPLHTGVLTSVVRPLQSTVKGRVLFPVN